MIKNELNRMANIIENYLNNTNKYSVMKSNVNKAFNFWLYEIIVNGNVLYLLPIIWIKNIYDWFIYDNIIYLKDLKH